MRVRGYLCMKPRQDVVDAFLPLRGSPSLLVKLLVVAGTIWGDANPSYPRYQSPAS
jgi:hypothetical protein